MWSPRLKAPPCSPPERSGWWVTHDRVADAPLSRSAPAERIGHLLRRSGWGRATSGPIRLHVVVHPPFAVERDQPHVRPEVHDLRARAAAAAAAAGRPAAELAYQGVLPPDRVPARHGPGGPSRDCPGPGCLAPRPSGSPAPGRRPSAPRRRGSGCQRRHAPRVDVVAQEDHELVNRAERVGLAGELVQHRLAVVGLAAGVADEEQRELDAVERRHRRRLAAVAGSKAGVQQAAASAATPRRGSSITDGRHRL